MRSTVHKTVKQDHDLRLIGRRVQDSYALCFSCRHLVFDRLFDFRERSDRLRIAVGWIDDKKLEWNFRAVGRAGDNEQTLIGQQREVANSQAFEGDGNDPELSFCSAPLRA